MATSSTHAQALDNMAALEQLILSRRSIRRFQKRDVPDELLLRALSLARWAPNGGNRQPWHFFVIKDHALIEKIAAAVQAASDRMAAWPEASAYGETVARWQRTSAFFKTAPVLIAVFMGNYRSVADMVLEDRLAATGDPDAARMAEARRLGSSRLQSVAAAISYLLLALHQLGLGACWMAGPQQAKEEIETLLGNPTGLDFVALIPVGYPAETPRSTRQPVEEVVTFLR